jgi:hypothetical protein
MVHIAFPVPSIYNMTGAIKSNSKGDVNYVYGKIGGCFIKLNSGTIENGCITRLY